jgi:hypothetical protein
MGGEERLSAAAVAFLSALEARGGEIRLRWIGAGFELGCCWLLYWGGGATVAILPLLLPLSVRVCCFRESSLLVRLPNSAVDLLNDFSSRDLPEDSCILDSDSINYDLYACPWFLVLKNELNLSSGSVISSQVLSRLGLLSWAHVHSRHRSEPTIRKRMDGTVLNRDFQKILAQRFPVFDHP